MLKKKRSVKMGEEERPGANIISVPSKSQIPFRVIAQISCILLCSNLISIYLCCSNVKVCVANQNVVTKHQYLLARVVAPDWKRTPPFSFFFKCSFFLVCNCKHHFLISESKINPYLDF